jgi:predicted DNA-binding transcriptional regulator YafY
LLLGDEDRRNVFIIYHSRRSTEPTTHPISPHAIRLDRDAVYVIARSEQLDEIRLFELDRISDAEVTPVPLQLPKDFDADEYLASALGVFAGVKPTECESASPLAPPARPQSETTWHPSQQLEPQPEGSVIATLEAALTPALVGWVLSIGRDAAVVEPPELIERIRDEIAAVGDRYAVRSESHLTADEA